MMASTEWFDDDPADCPECNGEGYVYDCQQAFACVDPESGCDLCMRRCQWCAPAKPTTPGSADR